MKSAGSTIDRELEELEGFALKSHSYGRLTGQSLAIHSIPDAFLVLHTGVGCKYKGAGQYCLHDLARPSHHREGYTEVTDLALIKGSANRIGIYVRNWYKKRKPSFMGVATMTFLEMTGEDFGDAVKKAAKTVPCPVAYLPAPGFEGDLYDGYSAVIAEILKRVPFKKTRPKKARIGIIGYPFDRYEMDHAGNLQQLKHLLGSIGLEAGPVLLSGRPYAELMDAASCERLIALPYIRSIKDPLKKIGRPVTWTGIPVGVSGTFRWLKEVGAACGVKKDVVDKAIRREWQYARPQLDTFKNYASQRLGSGRLAVFADTPLAVGLVSMAVELGLNPGLVALRDWSLGGKKAFAEALKLTGVQPPKDLEIIENPSIDLARRKISALRDAGRLSVLLASHTEISAVDPRGERSVRAVEIGFPSLTHHVLYPTPFYGVAGSLALAQRIMNLIR